MSDIHWFGCALNQQGVGMIKLTKHWQALVLLIVCVPFSAPYGETIEHELSLAEAIKLAKINDPWLKGSGFTQSKLKSMAVAAGQLPDPQMSVGLAGLGADNFSFNQEAMTQLKVGVTQMLSRGKTRSLKTEQMNLLATEQPLLRANRMALLSMEASQLWLDTYLAQESISLIEKDRSLFEQLVDLVAASYASGYGQTRQHDLIRAELELTRLEDRLTLLRQAQEDSSERLNGLIIQDYFNSPKSYTAVLNSSAIDVSSTLPVIEPLNNAVLGAETDSQQQALIAVLMQHPAVQAVDTQIEAENKGVELAEQKYRPAWGVNASYGYRADADSGMSRADLFSVGVTFDLPIFTRNRQDQEVKAAVASVSAKESQKTLLLRQMMSSFAAEKSKLLRLQQRQQLYQNTLLPQMSQQAQATLTAYTHDDGDFAEVVRSKIAELNAQIDALEIEVNKAKTITKINYLLAGSNATTGSNNHATGAAL